jgi:hypothetical protein
MHEGMSRVDARRPMMHYISHTRASQHRELTGEQQ